MRQSWPTPLEIQDGGFDQGAVLSSAAGVPAFSPEALGVNPGLVARITAKGLEYGKKLWPSAGLADLLGLAPDCSGYYSRGPDWAPSLRQPWLGLCATWALTCLSWVPTSQQRQRFGCK